MNVTSGRDPVLFEGRADVLSREEEKVLSDMRKAVRDLRALGLAADRNGLSQAATAIGGLVVGAGAEPGSLEFKRGAAHFSVRAVENGGVEISFRVFS